LAGTEAQVEAVGSKKQSAISAAGGGTPYLKEHFARKHACQKKMRNSPPLSTGFWLFEQRSDLFIPELIRLLDILPEP